MIECVPLLESALIVAAGILAVAFPVQLLILSFTVLGPLHYVTELAWLEERSFFLPRRQDAALLFGLGLLAIAPGLGVESALGRLLPSVTLATGLEVMAVAAVFIAAGMSLLLQRVASMRGRLTGIAILLAFSLSLSASRASYVWWVAWAVLLPTFVHVFLFTLLFTFHGALRDRRASGFLPVTLHAAIAGSILLAGRVPSSEAGQPFLQSYEAAFLPILGHLPAFLPAAWVEGEGAAVTFARFGAFAYTAHYLNWFVKAPIIGWHRARPARLVATAVCGAGVLAIRVADTRWGFALLAILSLLHVVLELPLNWRSLGGIGRELVEISRDGWRTGVPTRSRHSLEGRARRCLGENG